MKNSEAGGKRESESVRSKPMELIIESSTTRRLLNARQAAAYLGVSRSTFFKLPLPRVGVARGRFDIRDLDAFIESRKSPANRVTEGASIIPTERETQGVS